MNNKELFNMFVLPNMGHIQFTAQLFIKDKAYKDDIMQDIMLHLYRCINKYDPGKANIRSWLFITVKNCVLKSEYKYISKIYATDDFRNISGQYTDYNGLNATEGLKAAIFDVSDKTLRILQTLNDKQAVIISLRYAGYTFNEIAQMTNWSRHRCANVIQDFINKYNGELIKKPHRNGKTHPPKTTTETKDTMQPQCLEDETEKRLQAIKEKINKLYRWPQ